jgi:hypothetical protein
VLSGLKALNGQLEFFNVDEFEILAAAEHFMATNVEWDPTGGWDEVGGGATGSASSALWGVWLVVG